MRTALATLLLPSLAILASSPLLADEAEAARHQQRTLFLHAKQALERGDSQTFSELIPQLQDYTLYPYLVYWHLRDHLAQQSPITISAFLKRYGDLPIAPVLRDAWLRELARRGEWKEYLANYQGQRSSELRCDYHYAQLQVGKHKEAWLGAEKLWLVGRSQSDACDPLFEAWEKSGGLTHELRWQRIELAMDRGNSGLARFLAKPLGEAEQEWISLWRQVDSQPQHIISLEGLATDTPRNRAIVLHGLERLADAEPVATARLWPAVAAHYSFSDEQKQGMTLTLARELAFAGDPLALEWFARIPAEKLDENSLLWAIRVALRQQKWESALAWLERLPASEQQSSEWRYWQARVYEALGNKTLAQQHYQAVSDERGYYGFLAADHLGADYNLSHQPLEVAPAAVAALKQLPGIVRAHELYYLLLTNDARREWDHAVAKMDKQQRLAAGKLADQWQWHDRALLTLARAGHFDDLTIRFPLVYSDAILHEAEQRAIDPAWIYAVARQESAMVPDIQSPAGALGLMQLMPATGKAVARQLDNITGDRDELLQPLFNIRLGSFYLRQVLEQFDGNPVLATAAYNAGPHRVRQWYPSQGSIPADIWVDTIPFSETRQYVRRVMAYSVFYDMRLDKPITRLSQRMPAVSNKTLVGSCDTCHIIPGDS